MVQPANTPEPSAGAGLEIRFILQQPCSQFAC
jgi:hypothetical protein